MECFYLIANSMKDSELKVTGEIRNFLVQNGKKCIVQAERSACSGFSGKVSLIPDDVDVVIVLGGDGTLIQAARDMVAVCSGTGQAVHKENDGIPLLGVNLGTLGFLADVETEQLIPSLRSLLDGEYEIEERMMLDGTVTVQGGRVESVALNDIVINRYGRLRIMEYRIFVNGKYLCSYRADGVIVSTPTGSTGYSLSAGGPIVEPKARLMVITPICPHTLNARSIVLSADDTVQIEVEQGGTDGKQIAEATFDGSGSVRMDAGDVIRVAVSQKTTKLIRIQKESFITTLGRKFRD